MSRKVAETNLVAEVGVESLVEAYHDVLVVALREEEQNGVC